MKMIRYVAAALAALFSLQTSAAVFLKALGVNEERTTLDGTSWATAYTNAQDALTAALASADGTLYVAAGVYPLSSQTAVGAGTLKIYGGFAGVEGETLEQRDTEAHQSIFTGDKNGNDCYIHYELSTNATPSVTKTKMEDKPIVSNGRFNPPPAYTGEYDIYAAANNNDTGIELFNDNHASQLFTFSNGATFVLDGIYLIGYRNTLVSASGTETSVTINDCRFYANRGSGVSVENLKSFTLSNSHFAYGVAEANGGLWCASPGLVTNCQFESIYNTGTLRGGIIHINTGRTPIVIADSTFHRIARHGKSELAHGGPAVCIGAETGSSQPLIRDCEFTFCWNLMTESATGCSPIVGTAGGSWYIEDSRFEHNFISCSVKSGYSYFLVGQHATAGRLGGAYFRNTVFADNVIAAHADEGQGNYALGIAGSDCHDNGGNNYANAPKHVFVNCLFDRNFAEDRTGRSGVAPVLAEGILASANTFGTICGAANCTFISATSANPSVALVGSRHYWPVNVVNCLFLSDADIAKPFYSPVVPTDTIGLRAYSCTAQNCFTVPRNVVAEGWQTDWVPLEEDKDSFPVVKVLTPGLRETADLAVTDYYVYGQNVQYRFRPYGSDAWQTLHAYASVVTTEPEALVADAVGDSRPVGGVTRGCVQSLTADGELGKAVILRREPFGGGDLGGAPSAQNAGALDQPVVTAAPIEGAGFQGWYNEAGSLVGSNPEIDLSSFASGAILTAKFATKTVTVTFDLGQGGLFVDNNASTISYTMREGDVFPELPPYVESDEWLVEGWAPSFPSFVPNEDLTIEAQLLTKASRVFRIVPPGEVPAGSDRSGSSWANATDDIAAAAADAARYRGELWFKEGTYKLEAPISLYSNVAFIGGFNGTETERNQADPSAHVTLLTGDLNGGNYWLPQGSDPGEGNRTLVFDYETRTLNVPQPASDVQIPVWRVKYTSNAANAFSDSATSSATNTLISGMTIACFSGTAINVTFIKSQTLVENCRFVGNSWDVDTSVVGVKGSLQMRHCDFRYNHGGVDFNGSDDDRLSVVDDCTFYCNEICRSRVFRYWTQKVRLTTSNCRFEDNVYSSSGVNSSIEFSGLGCTISNWVVRNTRTCPLPKLGNSNANANLANGYIAIGSGNCTFVRCRFEDNLLDYSTQSLGLSCQSAVFYQSGGNVLCQDCFIARNTVKSQKAYTERTVVTSVAALNGGAMTFINCTLLDNFADAMESTIAAAATVGDRHEQNNSGLAFVHCTLANNTAQGGIAAADLLIHPAGTAKTRHGIGILNSILHSKDPSYKPLQLLASTPPTILYSALSNININDFNTELDGTLWKDVTDNTSGIAAKTSVSPDGVEALGINSTSPLTHGTGTIVISGNRPYLWNADATDDNSTYLSLVEPTWYRNPSQVERPDATQPAPLPDAFGAPRIIGKLAAGALNAAPGGLMILVR